MLKRSIGSLILLTCLAATALQAGGRQTVTIREMKFTPATLNIKVGDTVTWTNADDRDHTVVAADDSFKSGNLGTGQSFDFTFTKPGTFVYTCTYHPRMRGTVVVTD